MGFEGLYRLGLMLLALGGGLLLLVFLAGAAIGRMLGMRFALVLPLTYLLLLAICFPFFAVVIHDATSDLFMIVVIGSSLPASILALKWFSGVAYSMKSLFFPVFILLGSLQYLAVGWIIDRWIRIRRGEEPLPEKWRLWGSLAAALVCLITVAIAVQPILENRSRAVVLEEDTAYHGQVLPAGSTVRSKKGNLDMVTLSRPLKVTGVTWPGGTRLSGIHEKGVRSVRLSEALEIQGVRCRESGESGPASVLFFVDGRIQGALLDGVQDIQGIRCGQGSRQQSEARASDYDLFFFPNGEIFWAFLAEDQEVQGMMLAGGSRLVIHQTGKVQNAVLATDQEIRGVRFAAKSTVSCFDSGGIHRGSLAGPQEMGGLVFGPQGNTEHSGAPGTYDIEFYRSGSAKQATLVEGQEYQGMALSGGQRVLLHENGVIQSAWLEEDQEIRGVHASPGEIWLHPSGQISRLRLAEPWVGERIEFPRGSMIHMSPTGTLQRVRLGDDLVIQGKAYPKMATLRFDDEGKILP